MINFDEITRKNQRKYNQIDHTFQTTRTEY